MPTKLGTYVVRDGDHVVCDVEIGNGHPGASTVYLAGQELGSGAIQLTGVPVGVGATLRGQTLVVTSVMQNEGAPTNLMSATVTLRGGPSSQPYLQEFTAHAAHESVALAFQISFEGHAASL